MMSSMNHRHTYYGGTTTITISHGNNTGANNTAHSTNITGTTANNNNNNQRKKYPTFGPYLIGSTLGEGEFGKVKLGWSKGNGINNGNSGTIDIPKQVAIKLIKRNTILKDSNKEVKIYREINALKQLHHPNIVKLDEVLQNSKYIGIVLEYASGGEFYKYIQKKRRLKEISACRLFSQLISGVSYIHSKGLVHRDLKLENLLLDKNENLIITDFGFVNEFYVNNELMKTSCGSPCYAAPELVISIKPYEARKTDIWSCGIILFAMLAGYLPWDDDSENPDGNDIAKLYSYITGTPLKFPEYINPLPRDLLRRILVSNPKQRVNSKYITDHKWLSPHKPFLLISPEEWDKVALSKNILRLPKHNNKKNNNNSSIKGSFNKPRPLSTCSTSSTGSNGEKRDSLIMDSTLLAFPAPPRESQSHVITMPSPPSPELRRSSLRNTSSHHRSNSAASNALQAVVEAEREIFNQRNRASSINSNFTTSNTIRLDSAIHSRRSISPHIENNTTNNNMYYHTNASNLSHSGVSSLLNKDNVIIESPTKTNPAPSLALVNDEETLNESIADLQIAYPLPPNRRFSPPSNNNSHNLSQFHSHLARTHRKPRPTSYHPGSFSTVLERDGPNLDFAIIPNSQNNSTANTLREMSPFESAPKLVADVAVSSSKSLEISPRLYPRRSFSIKSKISLDIESVSGDLIKSKGNIDSTIKKLQEQVDDNTLKPIDINSRNNKLEHPNLRRDKLRDPPHNHVKTQRKRFSLFPFYSNISESPGDHASGNKENIGDPILKNYNPYSNRERHQNNRQSIMISSISHEYQPSLPSTDEHPDNRAIDGSRRYSNRPSTTKKVLNFFKTRSMRI